MLVDLRTAQDLIDLFLEAGCADLGCISGLMQPSVDTLGDLADVGIARASQVIQAFDSSAQMPTDPVPRLA